MFPLITFPLITVVISAFCTTISIFILAYMCKNEFEFEYGMGFIAFSLMGMIGWAMSADLMLRAIFS